MTDPTTDDQATFAGEPAGFGTRAELLPLLPLTQGVVFPQMVVTIALETDEAKRAGAAAEQAGRRLILVPRVEGRYAKVGTIAQIENVEYCGRDSLLDVVTASGTLLHVRAAGHVAMGDAVRVHVPVERALVYPSDAAGA